MAGRPLGGGGLGALCTRQHSAGGPEAGVATVSVGAVAGLLSARTRHQLS